MLIPFQVIIPTVYNMQSQEFGKVIYPLRNEASTIANPVT